MKTKWKKQRYSKYNKKITPNNLDLKIHILDRFVKQIVERSNFRAKMKWEKL